MQITDPELRTKDGPFGDGFFAFPPRKCRNGK